jgi:hypothetical protein
MYAAGHQNITADTWMKLLPPFDKKGEVRIHPCPVRVVYQRMHSCVQNAFHPLQPEAT